MKKEDLNKSIKSIEKKLGKENMALIQDDLGIIVAQNDNTIKEQEKLNNTIEEQAKQIDNLVLSNANLFQQVGMEDKNNFNKNLEDEEPKQKFSFKSAFDEKGNFI